MLLTEEHEAIRRTIRRFIGEEINPHVDEWEEAEIFPAHEVFRKMPPARKHQKPKALMRGNATSRAPICSGTTMFIRPITSGMATKKIMMTPWAVKI